MLAIGVTPDTALAKDAGLALGIRDSIVVNERMETSVPDIYAVGDAVQVRPGPWRRSRAEHTPDQAPSARWPSFPRGWHIDGFRNIPVDELRERLDEVEPGKPVYVICQSGLRSYIAWSSPRTCTGRSWSSPPARPTTPTRSWPPGFPRSCG